ncbi:hypothetical protein WJX73_004248 [Symbiochloris irregularis]|uniref:RNA helicase n=1 Tax=Symbiochloris irregularis TaxID=706552 RepID=A0AAW1NIN4_9CHLO
MAESGGIAVTQPRRVAAVSVARRVAEERRCSVGQEVGFAIRFEQRCSSETRILYLTDGMLMRECLVDDQLSKYAVIVLDEAHERTLNTDILFGVLKSLVQTREQPLHLVVTSATLDGDKFSSYFRGCPVLTIPGRCFPVQLSHLLEAAEQPYLQLAVDKALDLHLYEEAGDILVFLTGQAEIEQAVAEITSEIANMPEHDACPPAIIIPLYAALPPEQQARVFEPAPDGCRRIIVATNVAETSITVDGVVYVVDTGVVKQKAYDPHTGMETLTVTSISKVQAIQRSGRAGRTRPGKCFRLYTRADYDQRMPAETVPEILRTSLQAAVLHLKTLPLQVDVLHFDYMDAPKRGALEDALRHLYLLGALTREGAITPLGRLMAQLPLEPVLARTLLAAAQLDCLGPALTVVAMLSAESIFQGNRGPEQTVRQHAGDARRLKGRSDSITAEGRAELAEAMQEGLGDHVLLLRLFQGWQAANYATSWCTNKGLSVRGMRFAREVRGQLEALMASQDPPGPDALQRPPRHGSDRMHGSSKKQKRDAEHAGGAGVGGLRRAILAGSAGRLARRMDLHNGYRTLGAQATLAQLHPCTARIAADEDGLLPEWIVYNELVATPRVYLSKVCPVESAWVADITAKLQNVDVERLSDRWG